MQKVVTLEIETEETNEALKEYFGGLAQSAVITAMCIQVQVMQIQAQEEGDA
jgi:hypothetical protein